MVQLKVALVQKPKSDKEETFVIDENVILQDAPKKLVEILQGIEIVGAIKQFNVSVTDKEGKE